MCSCLAGTAELEGVSEALPCSRRPEWFPTEWLSPCRAHPGLGVSEIRKWHGSGLCLLDFPPPLIVFWEENFVHKRVCFGTWWLAGCVWRGPSYRQPVLFMEREGGFRGWRGRWCGESPCVFWWGERCWFPESNWDVSRTGGDVSTGARRAPTAVYLNSVVGWGLAVGAVSQGRELSVAGTLRGWQLRKDSASLWGLSHCSCENSLSQVPGCHMRSSR